jgi:cell division protease FtsH
MISEQYERAKALLREHKEGHAELAKILMEREVIFAEDVEKIFGKRPWTSRSEEIFASNEPVNDDSDDKSKATEATEQKKEANGETATA